MSLIVNKQEQDFILDQYKLEIVNKLTFSSKFTGESRHTSFKKWYKENKLREAFLEIHTVYNTANSLSISIRVGRQRQAILNQITHFSATSLFFSNEEYNTSLFQTLENYTGVAMMWYLASNHWKKVYYDDHFSSDILDIKPQYKVYVDKQTYENRITYRITNVKE